MMYLPSLALGMGHPDTELLIPLFSDYQEQADIPFAVFQATLQVQSGTGLSIF